MIGGSMSGPYSAMDLSRLLGEGRIVSDQLVMTEGGWCPLAEVFEAAKRQANEPKQPSPKPVSAPKATPSPSTSGDTASSVEQPRAKNERL